MTDIDATLVWKFPAGEHKTLWTYFITVATAVVGFAFSGKIPSMPKPPKVALVFAYVGFLTSNIVSLASNLCVHNAATAELQNFREQLGAIAGSFTITPVPILVAGHLTLDLITVALVLHRGFFKGNARPGIPTVALSRKKVVSPNPSLYPTRYNGLRPLSYAGELKLYASDD